MGWESSAVVGYDLGPLFQGQTRRARLKSAYSSLIFGNRRLDSKAAYRKSWAGNLLVWLDLTVDPSFKVKRGEPNLKVHITIL